MLKTFRLISLAVLLMTAPADAQRARVDVDHVFIAVPRGGTAEAALLREHGFYVDTSVTRHTGGGTASRGVYFGNAYLELIWRDPDVGVSAESKITAERIAQAAQWRQTGGSPFGVGLRRRSESDSLHVPSTRITAQWMQPGTALEMLTREDEPAAFELFVVPQYLAVPAWIGELREKMPQFLQHTNGSAAITAVEVHGPASHRPGVYGKLDIAPLRFVPAAEVLLVLELDSATTGKVIDLRPRLPLIMRR